MSEFRTSICQKKPDSDARRKKYQLKEPGFINLIIINLVKAFSAVTDWLNID